MKSNIIKYSAIWLGFVLSLVWWGTAAGTTSGIIVYVNVPNLAWNGSTLEAKLVRHLSRYENTNVMTVDKVSDVEPEFPTDLSARGRTCRYNLDSLTNWGREVGARYLLIVDVDCERLQKKKSFHLPLVFHQYRVFGVIEGELRLIDIRRKKLLIAESFKVKQKGPRIFQATMDDDINDPDLHLTASEKLRFFDRLEEKLALRLVKKIRKVIRLR